MKNKKFMGRVLACVLTGAMALSMAAFAAETTGCSHGGYLKEDSGDGKTHDFVCVDCGEIIGSEAHSFNEDGECVCHAKKACAHGTGYLKINTGDGETHDLVCVDCDEIIGNEKHTFGYNKDGSCACRAKAPVIPDEDYDAAMNVETEPVVITVTYMCDGTVVKTIDYTMDGESDTFTVVAPNGFVFSKNFNTELNVSDANGKAITTRTVFVYVDETFDSDIFVDAGETSGSTSNPDEYYPIDGDMMDASMGVSRSFISVVLDFLFGWTRYIFK